MTTTLTQIWKNCPVDSPQADASQDDFQLEVLEESSQVSDETEVEREGESEERLDMDASEMIALTQELAGTQTIEWDEIIAFSEQIEQRNATQDEEKPDLESRDPTTPTKEDKDTRKNFWDEVIFVSDQKLNEKKRPAEQMPEAKLSTRKKTTFQSSMKNFMTSLAHSGRVNQDLSFRDTQDTWFLPSGRMFRVGETFQITTSKKFEGVYFTISSFQKQNLRKQAVCSSGPCMDLALTFIGREETMRLIKKTEWKSRFANNPEDCDKVGSLRTTFIREGNQIPLTVLDKQYAGAAPNPFLVYACGPTEKTMSVDFNIAYICRTGLDPSRWMTRQNLPHKPVGLELFAGCGGMSLGLAQAGFDMKYMVEKDEFAASTLARNHPNAEVFDEDVDLFLDKVEKGDLAYPKKGDVDLIHSSSPCQGFSMANRKGVNKKVGKNDEANNKLSFRFLRAVRYYRPRIASFENVTGMLCKEYGNVKYMQKIIAELLEIGYQSRLFIVDASHHGCPQKRKRVILFAAPFECYLPDAPKRHEREPVTIDMALQDLYEIEPVPGIGRVVFPDGRVITHHSSEGTELKTESDHLSQCFDGFARTVRRQRGVKHILKERDCTRRERLRIQQFPDSYQLCGPATKQRDQIGNAVPVTLAHCLGEKLIEALKKELPIEL